MTEPVDGHLYNVVCPACAQYLGRVLARHADFLAEAHASKCAATPYEKAQAIFDVEYAHVTGDTTALERKIDR